MPNRIIKESILTSPNFNKLSTEAERHFYRLLLIADDYGCFEASPLVVKGKCYPYQEQISADNIETWQKELADKNIIKYWEQDSERLYGVYVNWDKHNSKYSVTDNGKPTRHRRKTPEPPSTIFSQSLPVFANSSQDSPYNHNPKPKPERTYCPSEKPTDTTSKETIKLGTEQEETKQQKEQLIKLFDLVNKDTQKLIKEYVQLFKSESMRQNKRDILLSKKLRLLSELVDLQNGAGKFDGKIIGCSQEQFRIALEEVCNREFSSQLQNHNYLKRVLISTVNKGDNKIWAAAKTKLLNELRQNKGICPECGGETKRNMNLKGQYQMYCKGCEKGSKFYYPWEYEGKGG